MSTHTTSATPPRPVPPAPPARGGLRLLPGQGQRPPEQLPLALEWEVAPGIPAVPPVPTGLRLVTGECDGALADLPEPGKWVAQLAGAVAEVVVGERPPAQLTRWVARPQLAMLSARATHAARTASRRARSGGPDRRVVKSVRVCPVAPGIVEASAVIVGSERAHAIAIRLEAVSGRWLATAIEMR